jgi:hypothetical protein
MSVSHNRELTQGRNGGARILRFPIHTVSVWPAGEGGWFVIWRTWAWLHGSRESAVNDAWAIARAHNVRVVER